jgi:hypothetical protein
MAIALYALSFPELTPLRFRKEGPSNTMVYSRIAGVCVMAAWVYYLSKYRMGDALIDINNADMLPIIRVMNQRFVTGQWYHIYDPIPEIWNGIRPIYLPAMWLPFAASTIFKFDMRWITVGGLFFAFSSFMFLFHPKKHKILSVLGFLISAILFCWLFSEQTNGFISMTEEGVVVAYYALLVLALLSGNMVFIGIATSLCMLSRYALIGWIPAFLLYLLLYKKRKQAVIFSVTGIVCLLVICILPFGIGPFISLTTLPAKYVGFAGIVWVDSPDVFQFSLGFAKFFGQQRISLLHGTLIVLSFIVPALFILGCYVASKKQVILSNVPLAALKITLVVFYNFIDVPYAYLFYTSSFISLLMIASLLRQEESASPSVQKVFL